MTIRAIFSVDGKNAMGNKGKLLYNASADLKRFKKLTEGDTVLMGRGTWESLPIKPLPNRHNVIVTNSIHGIGGEAEIVNDAYMVLDYHHVNKNEDLWIIGGPKLIEQAILEDYVEEIYMTVFLDDSKEADTFFDNTVLEKVQYNLLHHELETAIIDGTEVAYVNTILSKKKPNSQ